MKIIVSGGGTGGHIYPALSIMNALIKRGINKEDILYIGTLDRMEKDIIPKEGFNYIGLDIKGLDRKNLLKNFKVMGLFIKAYFKASKIIKDFKPDLVLGIGGYITLPVLLAAQNKGIKTFIHEQNAVPGLANKIISKRASLIGVSFEESLKYFKKNAYLSGNPVSEEAYNAEKLDKRSLFNDDKKIVLIVMGSLGSMTVNAELIKMMPNLSKRYNYVIVTGKKYFHLFKEESNIKVLPYINNMKEYLKTVDLIVSRAGATTIAEITAAGLPSILVPSPYVTHNHQELNALSLEKKGASFVLLEKDFNADNLNKQIEDILEDEALYISMVDSCHSFFKKDAASDIADKLLNL